MKVIAKFVVESKTETSAGYEVKLVPVSRGSEENKNFFRWTPYGELRMGLVSEKVAEKFVVGDEYYLEFTRCEVQPT